jgi:hypothetical protein
MFRSASRHGKHKAGFPVFCRFALSAIPSNRLHGMPRDEALVDSLKQISVETCNRKRKS